MKIKKKIAAFAAAAIALMGLPATAFAAEDDVKVGDTLNGVLMGDVNSDGKINRLDLNLLEKFFNDSGSVEINMAAADVVHDGVIDIDDVSSLLIYLETMPITDYQMGDVNNDGEIDSLDVVILNEYIILGVTAPGNTFNKEAADMTHDYLINVYDSILVKRTIMGYREVEEVHIDAENPTEAPTEAPTDVPQTPTEAPTEAPTETPTEAQTVITVVTVTEPPVSLATSLTYPAETSIVTTVVVTEDPTEAPQEPVGEALPYEAKIDPANTDDVESVSFKVNAGDGVNYTGAVQFFDKEDNMYVISIDNTLAKDGVITLKTEDAKTEKDEIAVSDLSSIKLIKIVQYWTSDKSKLTVSDVKIVIGGEEKDPYVEPAKELSADAVLIGQIGEGQYWSAEDWEAAVVPTITRDGKYSGTFTVSSSGKVQFLALSIDGLRGEDYKNLEITLDSVTIEDLALECDLSKAVIDTGYKEGSFDGTRIYLTDTWGVADGDVDVIPADTVVSTSVNVEFTVSGIE